MSFTTATSGRAGFVRLGTGVSGNSDGTLVTTSVPGGVTTGSSPSLASVIVTNTTVASSTITGALQVKGGVGIGGSLYAGPIYSNGVLVNTAGVRGYTGDVGGILGDQGWYVTSTTGSPDPSTTEMTFNSATAATTTVIKLNKLDANSKDWTNLFNLYTGTSTGYLTLYYTNNDLSSAIYYRIDSCTTDSSIFTFNVTYITIGTSAPTGFIAGLNFAIALSGVKGAQGATGTFSGSTSAQVQFTNATAATSTSTGALQVLGGASVQGALYVGNQLVIDNSRRNAANDGNLYSPDGIIFKDYYGTGNTVFNMNNSGGGMNLKTSNTSTKLYIGCGFSFGSEITFTHDAVVLAENKSFFVNNIVQRYDSVSIVSNVAILNLAVSNKFRIPGAFSTNLNFINAPQDVANYYLNVLTWEVIIDQGSSAYGINNVSVNGSTVTVKWLGGSAPAVTANRIEVITFTVLYNGTYTLLARLSSYG
jgi:hypothetical protein